MCGEGKGEIKGINVRTFICFASSISIIALYFTFRYIYSMAKRALFCVCDVGMVWYFRFF